MPLVVPTICRYTVHGSYGGRPCFNVVDFQIDTTGSTMPRDAAITAHARVILDSWVARILPVCTNEYTFSSVSWLDLNSATGSLGSIGTTPTNALPKVGTFAGSGLAGNTSVLVTKTVTAARGSRNGRLFLCAVPESSTAAGAPNILTGATVTVYNGATGNFYGDTTLTAGGPTGYQAHWNVVHITSFDPPVPPHKTPSPATGVGHAVTGLTVNPVLATQRRRLRG